MGGPKVLLGDRDSYMQLKAQVSPRFSPEIFHEWAGSKSGLHPVHNINTSGKEERESKNQFITNCLKPAFACGSRLH